MTDATTQTTTKAKTLLVFQTKTCGRCGGSGTYSRCATWGTTCFKCGRTPGVPGSGKVFTAGAIKAMAAIIEFQNSLAARKATVDVQVGDVLRVHVSGYKYRNRTVVSVDVRPDLRQSYSTNGERHENGTVLIGFRNVAHHVADDVTVMLALTPDQIQQTFKFAKRYRKAVTIVTQDEGQDTAAAGGDQEGGA